VANEFFPVTLAIDLVAQQRPGECLAACALMVLRYLKTPAEYRQLVRVFGISDIGAPFSRLARLNFLGVQVTLASGTLLRLHEHLVGGQPAIVSLETRELPYWRGVTSPHAAVVCGIDQAHVQVLDPGFSTGPFRVTHGDFELAWLERDEQYAVMSHLT
jgi:ABC-type bacteriocin/lantibiotic exporter with double-glycine peptidase domain